MSLTNAINTILNNLTYLTVEEGELYLKAIDFANGNYQLLKDGEIKKEGRYEIVEQDNFFIVFTPEISKERYYVKIGLEHK